MDALFLEFEGHLPENIYQLVQSTANEIKTYLLLLPGYDIFTVQFPYHCGFLRQLVVV